MFSKAMLQAAVYGSEIWYLQENEMFILWIVINAGNQGII